MQPAPDNLRLSDDTRLSTLLDNLPDYVLQFDSKLRLNFHNRAAKSLLERADLELLDHSEQGITLSRTLTRLWFRELLDVLHAGKEARFELQAPMDGISRSFEVRAVPDVNPDTHAAYVICLIRDVTDHKQIEAQRMELALERQRLNMMASFTQGVAHDLRTPLSSISVDAYMVRQRADDTYIHQYTDSIMNGVKQISRLLENMLLISNLDSSAAMPPHPVDLSQIMQDTLEYLYPVAQEKKQDFFADIEPGLMIMGNIEYLQQAFEHIIYNAIKYTDCGGKIYVRVSRACCDVIIECEDTGSGIPEDETLRIFERFYRGDESRPRDTITGGGGLGLSIAKAVIERHKGSIEVKSTVGEGSRFTIRIPAHNCLVFDYSHILSDV